MPSTIMSASDSRSVTTLLSSIQQTINIDNAGNYYPVFHRAIARKSNIQIRGRFYTDDSTDNGVMSYITVGRQSSEVFGPEGLGLAWRKSTFGTSSYDAVDTSEDITINGSTSQEGAAVLNYNLAIVDNSFLSTDTFINSENLILADGGINNYIGGDNNLTFGRRIIEINTWYKFIIEITTNYQVTVWILDDSANYSQAVDLPYDADSVTGSPDNQYGYVLKKSSSDPLYSPNASGENFGISVLGTKNSRWYYNDLVVASLGNDYPSSLMKLDADPSKFTAGDPFHVYWRGWGTYDNGVTSGTGAKLFIWNNTDGNWELVGSNTASSSSPSSQQEITASYDELTEYIDGDNYVTLVAVPTEATSSSTINTHYVEIDNVQTDGIHIGGMSDIYVNAPSRILQATIDVPNSSGTVNVSSANGFSLPVMDIISVSSAATGAELTRGTDYTVSVSDSKYAFSSQASLQINFSDAWTPMTARVLYRYYDQGTEVQSFLTDRAHRNPGLNTLLKIRPPLIITANSLEYRGTASEEAVKTAIKNWVNAKEDTIEVSDLINHLYNNGVDYVNLTSLDLQYTAYDYTGTLLLEDNAFTDTVSLSGLQAFFTDTTELYGVTKVG